MWNDIVRNAAIDGELGVDCDKDQLKQRVGHLWIKSYYVNCTGYSSLPVRLPRIQLRVLIPYLFRSRYSVCNEKHIRTDLIVILERICRKNATLATREHIAPQSHRTGIWYLCANSGRQIIMATTLCTAANNTCGFSVWNSLYVILLASRTLKWLLHF
jgi:hypothetical protein